MMMTIQQAAARHSFWKFHDSHTQRFTQTLGAGTMPGLASGKYGLNYEY